jgi:ornithine cyclodeaminase/alanine dehydrogenase-like protein (mu-crystallin family)
MTEAIGRPVEPASSGRDAVRGAGVVLVATNTASPALERDWLLSDAVVASIAPGELAPDVVVGSCLVPCAAEEVLSGTPRWEPVRTLVEQRAVDPAGLATGLGDLVAGTRDLGRGPGQLTVFLNTGMAFWDVAIADWLDRCARRLGLGKPFLPGGGSRTGTGFVPPRVSERTADG